MDVYFSSGFDFCGAGRKKKARDQFLNVIKIINLNNIK